ncbi:MAG: dihydrofolate reductase family protein, partial [Actinomycetota bacterium]
AVARPGAVVVTTSPAPAAARRALVERGVEVVEVPAAPAGGVDLPTALRALAELGVCSVLAEPGRTLAGALLEAGLVDRLVLHIAVGQGRGPLRRALHLSDADWRTERLGGAGEDLIHHLLPTERSTHS